MFCFIPKNSKYKKHFLVRYKNLSYKSYKLVFGDVGFKSLSNGYLNSKQLTLINKLISKRLKKKDGQFWVRVFPFLTITKKPSEVRMGKGKGNVDAWVCPIRKGQIIFEFKSVNKRDINDLVKFCSSKLPLKFTKIYRY